MAAKRGTRQLINIWELSQCYVHDFAPVFGPETTKTLSGWIRSRSVQKLATCSSLTSLSFARDAELVRSLLQVEALFKKNTSITVDGIDTTSVALAAFHKAETQCRITNRRLDYYLTDHEDRLDPILLAQIDRARRYISECLGPFMLFMKDLPKYIRLSSGATATHKRQWSAAARRLRRNATVSSGCWALADAYYTYTGLPGLFKGKQCEWNRILFVYKNFKTKRTIACEPEANNAFQLAFDSYAKKRLARKGQNLRCQERNQHEAYLGSIDGSVATEDFSQASDTVAQNAVAALFDPDWYTFLSRVRSRNGKLPDGSMLKYAKFSSMGNGATFAIETLIFAACCYAVGSRRFNVYGDDVTLEREFSEPFRKLTRFLGFTINTDKSYNTGLYRESCGKHYVSGSDVTPFFLRSLKWHKPNLCLLINGLANRVPLGQKTYQFLYRILLDTQLDKRYRLPIVAQVDDPSCGLHVSVAFAEDLGYLRWINSIPIIIRLVPKAQTFVPCHNHGSYWLWLILKERIGDNEDVIEVDELSRATGKYKVRKSVWHKPDGLLPPCIGVETLITTLDQRRN